MIKDSIRNNFNSFVDTKPSYSVTKNNNNGVILCSYKDVDSDKDISKVCIIIINSDTFNNKTQKMVNSSTKDNLIGARINDNLNVSKINIFAGGNTSNSKAPQYQY